MSQANRTTPSDPQSDRTTINEDSDDIQASSTAMKRNLIVSVIESQEPAGTAIMDGPFGENITSDEEEIVDLENNGDSTEHQNQLASFPLASAELSSTSVAAAAEIRLLENMHRAVLSRMTDYEKAVNIFNYDDWLAELTKITEAVLAGSAAVIEDPLVIQRLKAALQEKLKESGLGKQATQDLIRNQRWSHQISFEWVTSCSSLSDVLALMQDSAVVKLLTKECSRWDVTCKDLYYEAKMKHADRIFDVLQAVQKYKRGMEDHLKRLGPSGDDVVGNWHSDCLEVAKIDGLGNELKKVWERLVGEAKNQFQIRNEEDKASEKAARISRLEEQKKKAITESQGLTIKYQEVMQQRLREGILYSAVELIKIHEEVKNKVVGDFNTKYGHLMELDFEATGSALDSEFEKVKVAEAEKSSLNQRTATSSKANEASQDTTRRSSAETEKDDRSRNYSTQISKFYTSSGLKSSRRMISPDRSRKRRFRSPAKLVDRFSRNPLSSWRDEPWTRGRSRTPTRRLWRSRSRSLEKEKESRAPKDKTTVVDTSASTSTNRGTSGEQQRRLLMQVSRQNQMNKHKKARENTSQQQPWNSSGVPSIQQAGLDRPMSTSRSSNTDLSVNIHSVVSQESLQSVEYLGSFTSVSPKRPVSGSVAAIVNEDLTTKRIRITPPETGATAVANTTEPSSSQRITTPAFELVVQVPSSLTSASQIPEVAASASAASGPQSTPSTVPVHAASSTTAATGTVATLLTQQSESGLKTPSKASDSTPRLKTLDYLNIFIAEKYLILNASVDGSETTKTLDPSIDLGFDSKNNVVLPRPGDRKETINILDELMRPTPDDRVHFAFKEFGPKIFFDVILAVYIRIKIIDPLVLKPYLSTIPIRVAIPFTMPAGSRKQLLNGFQIAGFINPHRNSTLIQVTTAMAIGLSLSSDWKPGAESFMLVAYQCSTSVEAALVHVTHSKFLTKTTRALVTPALVSASRAIQPDNMLKRAKVDSEVTTHKFLCIDPAASKQIQLAELKPGKMWIRKDKFEHILRGLKHIAEFCADGKKEEELYQEKFPFWIGIDTKATKTTKWLVNRDDDISPKTCPIILKPGDVKKKREADKLHVISRFGNQRPRSITVKQASAKHKMSDNFPVIGPNNRPISNHATVQVSVTSQGLIRLDADKRLVTPNVHYMYDIKKAVADLERILTTNEPKVPVQQEDPPTSANPDSSSSK